MTSRATGAFFGGWVEVEKKVTHGVSQIRIEAVCYCERLIFPCEARVFADSKRYVSVVKRPLNSIEEQS